MEYIHIKNLEKYHPGYKDRSLQWCKIHFSMLNADPMFELLCEIDRWRFVAFIMLELQAKHPIPLDSAYLRRKGFDFKKRPIFLTVKMLHNFIDIVTKEGSVTQLSETCSDSVTQSRDTKSRDIKIISAQIENLLRQFSAQVQEKAKVLMERVALKNKSKQITEGRKLTLLTELFNSKERCNNEELFNYALEMSLNYDAPNIGYINAIIRNKKAKESK